MISATGLCKRFGAHQVLRGVDFAVSRGGVTGVVGPNGAGKSTLIKILVGLTRADAGSIVVPSEARDLQLSDRSRIGYMPQIARFPENLTGAELIAMLRDLRRHDTDVDEDLISRFGLVEQMHKPLRVLSGGTRQKINAAIAFLFRPDLLILDEPTAGLDPVAAGVLKDKIVDTSRLGRAVIVASHVMGEMDEICDDVLFLFDGTIRFAGPIGEIKRRTRQFTLERAVASMMIREVA